MKVLVLFLLCLPFAVADTCVAGADTKALGDACTMNEDCVLVQTVVTVDGNDMFQSAMCMNVGTGADGECGFKGSYGDDCWNAADCWSPLSCHFGMCGMIDSMGMMLFSPPCGDTQPTMDCTDALADGETCEYSSQCASGMCFGKTAFTCISPVAVGEACDSDAESMPADATKYCATKCRPNADGDLMCVDGAADGEDCFLPSHCASGKCDYAAAATVAKLYSASGVATGQCAAADTAATVTCGDADCTATQYCPMTVTACGEDPVACTSAMMDEVCSTDVACCEGECLPKWNADGTQMADMACQLRPQGATCWWDAQCDSGTCRGMPGTCSGSANLVAGAVGSDGWCAAMNSVETATCGETEALVCRTVDGTDTWVAAWSVDTADGAAVGAGDCQMGLKFDTDKCVAVAGTACATGGDCEGYAMGGSDCDCAAETCTVPTIADTCDLKTTYNNFLCADLNAATLKTVTEAVSACYGTTRTVGTHTVMLEEEADNTPSDASSPADASSPNDDNMDPDDNTMDAAEGEGDSDNDDGAVRSVVFSILTITIILVSSLLISF